MFRDAVIAFDQAAPLGELTVRWTGPDAEWTGENLSEEYEDTPVPETAAEGTEETHD